MALNKFMHPRNIYKTPPDFSKLLKVFEEFANVAKVDVTGKVSIDFKDPRALRILTKCLLKSDFSLEVDIPEDRLVPTLPLRLNYILWIEDLMLSIDKKDIYGLDIGTGACAIYPLLAAVKNNWHMFATEIDENSMQKAAENVEKNNLQHLIKLARNTSTSLIAHLFLANTDLKFDFCMCNPPFYSNFQDLCESRSPARPPPKNGFTGSPQELITEGGELEFCRRLIKESIVYKNNILIFTTMIGHKHNLRELILDLKAEEIKHTTTEFCQGRVTRWGIAWTYQNYDLYNLVPPRDKPKKKQVPISFELPQTGNQSCNVESGAAKIKKMFDCLNINYNLITKRQNEVILNFTASTNTWSNQRRKRRLMKRLEDVALKKQKVENQDLDKSTTECDQRDAAQNMNISINSEEDNCNTTLTEDKPLIVGVLKISKKVNSTVVEVEYLDGNGGKDCIHQILQYIKNNFK